MRPGTAPKQALVNNLAGQIQNRPMSPYSKNFNNANQTVTNMNTRKRSSSRRGPAPNHPSQYQVHSSNIQHAMYGKHITTQNQRRSQSPAANAQRGNVVSGNHQNTMINAFYNPGSQAPGNSFVISSSNHQGVQPLKRN